EFRLEERVRVGVDPDGNRAAPAVLLVGDVPLGREENAAIVRQYVHRFQATAGDALALGNAKRLGVEALFENVLALLGEMVGARGEGQVAAALVRLHLLIKGSVERDRLV